ncbi:OmpH family outer membrane protein [Desulfopila inferna]|uniref:OmpH family outer membrane protein n=1 Tax=Desulfopila inferna TaxID=468528 RepID=UPI0019655398|nr:OmpH family outer membrane protein [Desulfopila inferna]MBM9605230.1 OmpH family outer membrane protein [Desulfopila inferna]
MCLKYLKILVVCLSLSLCTSLGALAAQGDALKVGIMNVQKVLVQSEPGLKAKAVFEKKKSELEAAFRGDQQELEKLQEEIEKKSSVWSKEKKEEQILEFNRKRRDLQTKTEDAGMEMKRLQDKELEPIIKVLEGVVDTYGDKNGYSMILDSKNGVIFYNKDLDISDALIEELNKAMK